MEKQIDREVLNNLKSQIQSLINQFESAIQKIERGSDKNEIREKEEGQ